ncbi:MAG: hypothetical protein CMJ46_02915 [Planctomyces sp.]|nr:hypothetical protein [Planctomyces sp.]
MFRGTFALLQQALRTDSRKITTHLFMLMFVAFILFLLYAAEQDSLFNPAPGLQFFVSISFLNYAAIILAGLGFFSSAITEEKEDGTLGLLKMTGMSPLVLLLGKSTSRLIYALLLLSVQIPFVLLSITLGGVMLNQIIAIYIALAAFLIMIANFGLFASVISRTSSNAVIFMVASTVGVLVILFSLTIAFSMMRSTSPSPLVMSIVSWLEFIWMNTVIGRISTIMTTGFNESWFSWQVWMDLGLALFFFVCSWMLFERTTSASMQSGTGPDRADVFKSKKVEGKHKNRGRAWGAALAWKDFHFIVGGFTMYIFKYIVYTLILFGLCCLFYMGNNFRWDMGREELSGLLIGFSLLVLGVELAVMAARIFQEEVRWQTLSVLVMLPLSIPQIAYQKIAGCLWGLVPITSFLLLGCALAPENVFEFLENAFFNEEGFFLLVGFICGCIAFLHLIAYLSLYVKWGALPVAIMIGGFYNTACGVCTGLVMPSVGGGDGVYTVAFVWIGMYVLITVILHILTGEKLRDMASK